MGSTSPRKWPQINNQNEKNTHIEIVAEITTNHFGNMDRMEKLISGASKAGADSVKLQKRDINSIYTREKLNEKYVSPFGKTFGDYRKALELDENQMNIAYEIAKNLGLEIFYSALDIKSFEYLKMLGHTRIKLPSTISNKKDYLDYVSENYKGELVISTGMTDENYLDYILNHFLKARRIFLLHCISSYPTFPNDINIATVNRYARLDKARIVPGYSSHDVGIFGSLMAIGAGAKMIEKHIKLGNTEWGHFDDTAMDVNTEFISFVSSIRGGERIIGSQSKRVLPSEHHKY